MTNILYNAGKHVLGPFPKTKRVIKKNSRNLRTTYLNRRYPEGGYLKCNGAEIFCDFSSENYSWYDGNSDYLQYELDIFSSLFNITAPEIVLDIGAHWGFYPAYLAQHHSEKIKKIICVEADPVNQKILEKTIDNINQLKVEKVDAAISDEDGELILYRGGGACGQTYNTETSFESGRIPALSFDSLAERYLGGGERITHVKLDIDGFEPAFFLGGSQALQKHKPIIMLEFWAKGLSSSEFDISEYWDMLTHSYNIEEACFETRALVPVSDDDLNRLIKKTTKGITNLVLYPKDV